MYFSKFPLMAYDIKGNKSYKLLPDILRRVKLRSSLSSSRFVFDKYNVKEGEKPEDIAFKYYGDAQYHWVVMMANNLTDRYYEWPMTQPDFADFLTDKYGAGNEYAIKYYVTSDAAELVVHSSYAGAKLPVTNTDYEEQINDAKRRIKILNTKFVPNFVNDFNEVLVNGN